LQQPSPEQNSKGSRTILKGSTNACKATATNCIGSPSDVRLLSGWYPKWVEAAAKDQSLLDYARGVISKPRVSPIPRDGLWTGRITAGARRINVAGGLSE
jgi:hypothetical protein